MSGLRLITELREMTEKRDRLAEKVGPLAVALAEANEQIATLRAELTMAGEVIAGHVLSEIDLQKQIAALRATAALKGGA